MSAVLLTPLTGQFFDNNGLPLNGGLIYTYAAGTTTPQATYTDSTGTTPAANPIVLDSSGRANVWGSGTYKFVIKDSLGNTISTIDGVAAIYGAGDMTKAVYDPANIAQQMVGTTAVQTITNKTLTSPILTTPTISSIINIGTLTLPSTTGTLSMLLLNTLTASSSATLVDTTSITSAFNSYLLTFTNIVPATNAVKFIMRVSIDGGSTYKSTAYLDLSTNTDGIYISGNASTIGNNASLGLSGELLYNGASTSADKLSVSRATFYTGAALASFNGGGVWTGGTSAVNALQFLMSSGNISTGVIKIYGIT